jgi:hypothetical protein
MKEALQRERANEIKRHSLNVRLLLNLVVKSQTKRARLLPLLVLSLSFKIKHNHLASKQLLRPTILKTT